ncbi:MAG: LysM peptidoglycan-binding domain-containing protein [Luteolibacter sp.]
MKPTLLFATLSMVFASPTLSARSEVEMLRAKCAEQERQIQQLEQDNSKLRNDATPSHSLGAQTELVSTAAAKPAEITKPAETTKPAATSTPARSYKVQDNDTYSSIARKQKVSVAALIAANPSVKPTSLHTGQIISLGGSKAAPASPAAEKSSSSAASSTPVVAEKTSAPVSKTPPAPFAKTPASASVAKSATAKSESAPAATSPEKSSPSPEKTIKPITIDGEVTYGEFATKHGTNTERLNALNGLDLTNTTVLAKGSELYVPAQP